MEIGSIGAGALAQAFAEQALKAGHKLKLSNSRDLDSLREIVHQLGPGAMAATKEEAAACEMVLLAVPWDNVPETLATLPKWKNQILIDATNPFHGKAGSFTPANVGNLSTSQLVAALAPGARIVKALNNMIVPDLEANPMVNRARRVAFISADDDDAKKRVEILLDGFGYSVINLGNLRDGGLIQQAGGPLAGRHLLELGERHKWKPTFRSSTEPSLSANEGAADLVAFGRDYIANPDLVERIAIGAALNLGRPEYFYGSSAVGYIDYPFLGQETSSHVSAEAQALVEPQTT